MRFAEAGGSALIDHLHDASGSGGGLDKTTLFDGKQMITWWWIFG